jgi:hypothetical protein
MESFSTKQPRGPKRSPIPLGTKLTLLLSALGLLLMLLANWHTIHPNLIDIIDHIRGWLLF